MRAGGVLWAVLLIAGCGSSGPLPLNRAALRQTAPRSISGWMGRTPKFRVDTAGAIGALGFVAAAIKDSVDQSKLKGKRVHDPAEEITEALVDAVAQHFSMTVLDGDDIDRGQISHLVLRIQTTHWGLQTARQGGVGVVYEGTLTLVDNRSKAVLAEGMCSVYPYEGDSVEAVAEKLEQELRGVIEYCIDDYGHRVLGL